MKKIDLGRAVSILANVGVIAGIVFLAVELQQNNELLAAQARRDQLIARTAGAEMQLTNDVLAELVFKARNGESLTERETDRFYDFAYYQFRQWEWQYNEYVAGMLEEADWPVIGWRGYVRGLPILAQVWEQRKQNVSPDFMRFMDENVFNE